MVTGQVRAMRCEHRFIGVLERHAKVKPEHAGEPGQVLLMQWLVQAIARLEGGDLLIGKGSLAIPSMARQAPRASI